ncbi:MAG: di-trans,poly-cis-decaprenylcistransferase [Verrucomicrobia bacterium]|nr:di-trans,poly-cis-decaprenylcistransferase [Verrucomicrobiota bacterium]
MKNDLPPRHIAIIMDGNGRWAKERGWMRLKGHEQGAQSVQECLDGSLEAGVEYLTLYAFSSENWKRPKLEVQGLMTLLEHYLGNKIEEMNKNGIRFNAIGRLSELPPAIQKRLQKAIDATAHNNKLTLTLALNYGARAEIVDATKMIAQKVQQGILSVEEITEETIANHLYTGLLPELAAGNEKQGATAHRGGVYKEILDDSITDATQLVMSAVELCKKSTASMPDPDLFIRTSGEYRISNFLLWQLSYSELYITPKLWPDFKKADLLAAIEEFKKRERRFGGIG